MAGGALFLALAALLAGQKAGGLGVRQGLSIRSATPVPNQEVPLTLVPDGAASGAVCLDGSPPGYHLRKGTGDGADSWLLFLEGGGWCRNLADCAHRARDTPLGSSTQMQPSLPFPGILSNDPAANPDFHDWNIAYIRYCDGASFAGDVEEPVRHETGDIFFRGQRVWAAVMRDLAARHGLGAARRALLAGCSAGGLAALLHCDAAREFVPAAAPLKCLSDAGYFLDRPDIRGRHAAQALYKSVVELQSVHLGAACTAAREAEKRWECFFPEHLAPHVSLPIFLLQPAYDTWQIGNIYVPRSADRGRRWLLCKANASLCTGAQLQILHAYRQQLIKAMAPVLDKSSGGSFVNACFVHCQAAWAHTWHGPRAPRINNKTMAEAVGDWYFERTEDSKVVDCLYPCNPTCYKWR